MQHEIDLGMKYIQVRHLLIITLFSAMVLALSIIFLSVSWSDGFSAKNMIALTVIVAYLAMPIGHFLRCHRVFYEHGMLNIRSIWFGFSLKQIDIQDICRVEITELRQKQWIGFEKLKKIVIHYQDNKVFTIWARPEYVSALSVALNHSHIQTEVDSKTTKDLGWVEKDDIGYYAVAVALLSVPMVVLALYLDNTSKMIHLYWPEAWYGLILSIPLCIVLGYGFIRLEKKAHPAISAVVAGSILGVAVNYAGLKAVQLWNELQPLTVQTVEMTYIRHEGLLQIWQFNDPTISPVPYWVGEKWPGVNLKAEVGQQYQVKIYHAALGDRLFNYESFHTVAVKP